MIVFHFQGFAGRPEYGVGWPQCHANQVVPATGLVDDAMTPARTKDIAGQAGKPDLLPCRGDGFPAIRRRLTHRRVSCRKPPGVDGPSIRVCTPVILKIMKAKRAARPERGCREFLSEP